MALLFAGLSLQVAIDMGRGGRSVPEVQIATAPATPVVPGDTGVNLIAERHLFGVPTVVAPTRQVQPTRANLVLGGTWLATGAGGYALIGEPGDRQRPYRPGDRLPGGAQLVEIHADRVLLGRDGRQEVLYLPRGELAAAVTTAPPRTGPAQLLHRRNR